MKTKFPSLYVIIIFCIAVITAHLNKFVPEMILFLLVMTELRLVVVCLMVHDLRKKYEVDGIINATFVSTF